MKFDAPQTFSVRCVSIAICFQIYIFLFPLRFLLWPVGCSIVCCFISIPLRIFQLPSWYLFIVSNLCDQGRWHNVSLLTNTFRILSAYDFFWRRYDEHVRKMRPVLFIGWDVLCLLGPFALTDGYSSTFPIHSLSVWSTHGWMWGSEVVYYHCIVYFPL